MKTEPLYNHIVNNKLFFSGLAIIGILLSYLIGVDENNPAWRIFYPGFVGVDIFLFYSGYGLYRSLEKNSLKEFYIRRLKRIYPLFVVFTILLYAMIYWCKQEEFSAFDVFCNLTPLSFWDVGGICAEWYLSFIIYLYILFPLLYQLVRKWRIRALVLIFCILTVFLFFHREGWRYQCAASRIPIFLFGIYCYLDNNNVKTFLKGTAIFMLMFLVMSVQFMMLVVQKFELGYMAAPFIMLLLSAVFLSAINRQNKVFQLFSFFGKYSLEIYLSNILISCLIFMSHFNLPVAPCLSRFTHHTCPHTHTG